MERPVTPIASVTRRDAVLTELRDAILTGRLAPGDRLKEVHLAKELGVSRPTLREAIYQLIHEGLLVQEDYRGVAVASLDRSTVEDIALVRSSLEAVAAKLIAADKRDDARNALVAAWREYEQATNDGDRWEENEAHLRLHETIWMQSGNVMLQRMWPIVSAPVHVGLANDLASHAGDVERNLRMHRELVEAILGKDPKVIDDTVQEHIEVSAQLLIASLPPEQRDAGDS